MDIITSNQYLKMVISDLFSGWDSKQDDRSVIIDMTSQYVLPKIAWRAYSKFIIIVNDYSDIMLFNNARVISPVFYIHIDWPVEKFTERFYDALHSYIPLNQDFLLYFRVGVLSKRQFMVLLLTAKGLSLRQISVAMQLSIKTASGHRIEALKRINKRMSVATFSKLGFLSINQGLDSIYLKSTRNGQCEVTCHP